MKYGDFCESTLFSNIRVDPVYKINDRKMFNTHQSLLVCSISHQSNYTLICMWYVIPCIDTSFSLISGYYFYNNDFSVKYKNYKFCLTPLFRILTEIFAFRISSRKGEKSCYENALSHYWTLIQELCHP